MTDVCRGTKIASMEITVNIKEFGALVQMLRIDHGVMQRQLAERIRVSQQTVSLIEKGRVGVKPEVAEKIGEAMGFRERVRVELSDE